VLRSGEVGFGGRVSQNQPTDDLHRLGERLQRLLLAPQLREPDAETVQRVSEVGFDGSRVRGPSVG
jgi:hypothetical protein